MQKKKKKKERKKERKKKEMSGTFGNNYVIVDKFEI